jgi:hypothetical protein
MADFLVFDEGKTDLINNGLPATCTFDLSTKTVDELGKEATYGGGYAVATGTGYSAKTESEPTASKGKIEFAKKTWETGAATDWPAAVKSVVLRNGTSKLICAWNLLEGGSGRAMNAANTTQNYTPTLTAS